MINVIEVVVSINNKSTMNYATKFSTINQTLATTAIFLCVQYIRTSSISYSLTHVTAALHSALHHNNGEIYRFLSVGVGVEFNAPLDTV